MESYATDTKPIRGVFKQTPEDFLVQEIPKEVRRSDNGKYIVIRAKLREWDTNRFIIFLARELHISHKRITYCGTKDKHAVTTQYFSINHDFDPSTISISDCEILDWFRTDRMLALGDLIGNRFTVNLHLNRDDIGLLGDLLEELNASGGFPNYFGLQRFGSIRTNTHRVGKLLVEGKDEEAALEYIYDPEIDTEYYRKDFASTMDARLALKEFPMHLNFERTLLGYMLEHGTLRGSLAAFPKNLGMMFVHAYQSYLFNRIVSMRIRELGINSVNEGDVLYPVDGLFNSDARKEIRVNSMNRGILEDAVRQNRLRPSAPLIGFDTHLTDGPQGEFEKNILDEEGVNPGMFRLRSYPEFSSSGERRVVSCLQSDLTINSDGIMEFNLGRGIYATSLIREILKNNMTW